MNDGETIMPPGLGSLAPKQDDNDDEGRISSLLDVWQDAFDAGRDIKVEELCRDCPNLKPEVQRRIDVFVKMSNLAKAPTDGNINPEADPTSLSSPDSKTRLETKNNQALQQLLKILAPPQKDGELGRLGEYVILSLLGEGGMGAVFAAEDPMLNRRVALKVMKPEVAADPQARERFLREARSAAKLQHDNIVPIFHVGKENNVWFITMPLLQGETLDQRLKHPPALSLADSIKIGREAAQGLAAAHALGLIHRDIKPANIWLERQQEGGRIKDEKEATGPSSLVPDSFRVKILDFGLARPAVATEEVTRSGTFLGTPGFMSPEQIDGLPLDGRGDLFSLGCVLYRLTTSRAPFEGTMLTAVLRATADKDPVCPHLKNPKIPVSFSQLIMRLLQKKPDARYQSAQDLVEALALLEMVTARSPGKLINVYNRDQTAQV